MAKFAQIPDPTPENPPREKMVPERNGEWDIAETTIYKLLVYNCLG
jgi:hypothetical protein